MEDLQLSDRRKILNSLIAEGSKRIVFFDYDQDSKGKTLASIFSVRPTTSANVSMPVEWGELSDIQPAYFTLINVPMILSAKGGNAWSTIYQNKQDLLKMIQRGSF